MEMYMEQTVGLMAEKNPEETLEFFKDAEQCETESGVMYLVKIYEEPSIC